MAGKPKRQPWFPAEYDTQDIAAVQAVATGTASAEQQRRALRWIIESCAGAYNQSFIPGQSDVTAFLEGRRSVGNQIVKLTKLKVGVLEQREHERS